jgi:MoaA/NifB/PqqE/SkfB family radical SAM enzyme
MPYITYDGYVTSCCHIENPAAGNFGNVFERPFAEIWNGAEYRAFRRDFEDLSKNENCRVCPFLTKEEVAPFLPPQEAALVPVDSLLPSQRTAPST